MKDTATFKPFDITLTVQTKEEAQALYAMFNCESANKVLHKNYVMSVKYTIGEEFYISNPDAIIGNGVTYSEYYNLRYRTSCKPVKVPKGYQLVPIEPTDAMTLSGAKSQFMYGLPDDCLHDIVAIYQAMLKVAKENPNDKI